MHILLRSDSNDKFTYKYPTNNSYQAYKFKPIIFYKNIKQSSI